MTSYLFFKSFLDRFVALCLIILFFPVLLLISLLVLFLDGPPIFFTQPRTGYKNKTFRIYKFRTMSHSHQSSSQRSKLTKSGNFLRSSSLDELPSLFNILLGHMSFVGPRPLLVEYLSLYTSAQLTRHTVLPGLTGLAQTKGRNQLDWRFRFKYDLFYVSHYSLCLDLSILYNTIGIVFFRKGINSSGVIGSIPFTGVPK